MKLQQLPALYIIFLIASCANRVVPTGGEKDVKPPVLISAQPASKSTHFTSDKVTLAFDEYIQLKDIQQQLIVSPLMEPAPTLTVKKKNVIIDLPDTLQQNTTYTLNFGEAITDVHEGNVFPYQYIFSTGSVVDSLTVSGKATDAITQTGTKGIKVMLYRNFIDSLPLLKKPNYFALTNESGDFTINNISPGSYTAVALDDKNSNLKNDSRQDEAISIPITVTVPDTSAITLEYFTELPAELFVKSINSTGTRRWNINLSKPAFNASLNTLQSGVSYLHEWNATNDTLYIWSSDTVSDSLSIIISTPAGADTAVIRPKAAGKSGRGESKQAFVESTNTNMVTENTALYVKFYNPIAQTDSNKITLMEDSTNVEYKMQFTDSAKRQLKVYYQWKENKKYNFKMLPAAFTDFSGRKNDSLAIGFSIRSARELGSIEIAIGGLSAGSYILELINGKEIIAKQQVAENGKYIFDKLEPSVLKARIIYDSNGNGRWDTGNYFSRTPPETIIYYQGELQARGNWEVEVQWEIPEKAMFKSE